MTETQKRRESIDDLPNINVTVTEENLENDILNIWSQIFGETKKEDLVIEELQGGYVNSIQRVYLKKEKSKSIIFRSFSFKINEEEVNKNLKEAHAKYLSQQNGDAEKSVTNNDISTETKSTMPQQPDQQQQQPDQQQPAGFDLATFFSRKTEYQVMVELSKYDGLCQPVYAKYNNGIVYGYQSGVTLNGPLMLTNDFLNEMATKLAKFHSINFESPIDSKYKTHFEKTESQFKPMIFHMLATAEAIMNQDIYPFNVYPKLSSLVKKREMVLDLLSKVGFGEQTFCHNDTNQRNIIWEPQQRTLSFIDFEFCLKNYTIMEISMLFYCYTGHFLIDFDGDLFPNADYRKRFLRKYLEERNKCSNTKMTDDEFEEKLEKLFIRTNLGCLVLINGMTLMMPMMNLMPGFLDNDEVKKVREATENHNVKFGYKVYQLLEEIEDELMKPAKDYLAKLEKNEE